MAGWLTRTTREQDEQARQRAAAYEVLKRIEADAERLYRAGDDEGSIGARNRAVRFRREHGLPG